MGDLNEARKDGDEKERGRRGMWVLLFFAWESGGRGEEYNLCK